MARLTGRIVMGVIGVSVVVLGVVAFRPEPVPVDVTAVARAPMRVTVDEEGRTRIRERYVVSAPLAGRLRRIALDPGDRVVAEETIVAVIEPTDPSLLDVRAQAEAEARVRAAEAAVQQARARQQRDRSALDFAESELVRLRKALAKGGATEHEIEEAEHREIAALQDFRAAEFDEEIARFELEQARSALLLTDRMAGDSTSPASTTRFQIAAPISGRVLGVFQESVAIVTPGTPLLEIGDPTDLEVVVDVLSTAAVRIEPGATMVIEHWGGDEPLAATVRLVEPAAFTKVSALGVEEQRVNVVGDFVSPYDARTTLGDGFRVEARIVLWEADDVVQVPMGALFRRGEDWLVFVVEDGGARARGVRLGHRNGRVAEVLEGLAPGETVVRHPSDRVADGVRVHVRSEGP